MKYAHKGQGFTLVEIAVVLVIVGLIVGTLAPLMMSMIKKDKLKNGRDTVQRARDEIIGYTMINNGKLPSSINALSHRLDPWGNPIFLIVDPNLPNRDICSVNLGDSDLLSIIFYQASGGGVCSNSNILNNIVCIIGSKGPDYNRQISGLASHNRVGILDYGCQNDLFPADNAGLSSNRPFDDIYEYISLSEIKSRVCSP